MTVKIQKTIFGVRNIDNLIDSTSFCLKIGRFHLFFFNFIQVCVSGNDNQYKLVTELRVSGFPELCNINNLTKNNDHLLLEQKVRH